MLKLERIRFTVSLLVLLYIQTLIGVWLYTNTCDDGAQRGRRRNHLRLRDITPSGAIVNVFACYGDPEEYPDGVHYHLHYGYPDEDEPIVRYDNENIEGKHERHEGDEIEEIEFPGADALRERFENEVREHERTQ